MLVSLSRNDYEPNVCFWKKDKAKHFTDDQMQFPAPDLVVEVLSKSTAHTDRTTKFEDYQAHEIKEYWIVDPNIQVVEQYILHRKSYELIFKGKDGFITSTAIKNLTIPVAAIFDKKLTNQALAGFSK